MAPIIFYGSQWLITVQKPGLGRIVGDIDLAQILFFETRLALYIL